MKHVFIDYENVQPVNFNDLEPDKCHIWLFLGVHQQKKLPLPLVEFLLSCERNKVNIIKMQCAGKNALDFYLSFYLGKVVALYPDAQIRILSKDGDYDVLLEHLKADYPNIRARRTVSNRLALTSNTPAPAPKSKAKSKKPNEIEQLYLSVISRLKNIPASKRPARVATLKNMIKSQVKSQVKSEHMLNSVIRELLLRGDIKTKSNTQDISDKIVYIGMD